MERKRTHKILLSPRNKYVLPWQHLLPGVAEKLISYNLLRGMEIKKLIKVKRPRNKKVISWPHLLPGVAE